MFVKTNPNVSQWSLETGYQNKSNGKEYPFRVFSARRSAALIVYLQMNEVDLEYGCRGLVPGFKVFLHTPGEIPAMSRRLLRVPLQEDAEISIKPKMITTSDGLRNYKPSQRQCFYTSERRLRFFKVYAQTNCEMECLANFTKILCGCVQFSIPSINRKFKKQPLFSSFLKNNIIFKGL